MRTLLIPVLAVLAACAGGEEARAPAPTEAPAPAPEPEGYQGMATVEHAGTITGTVMYTGDKTDPMVEPGKDMKVCNPEGGERPAGQLVVNDGKLKNVVVYLPAIEKGKEFEVGTVTVDNVECQFMPHVAIGQKGGKVAAKNSDGVLHNTNLTLMEGGKKIANIALPQRDQVVEKPLRKGGIVDVQCDAHDWMQGYVFAAENPYATKTDENGAFELTEVPAGEYDVWFWHEMLGEKEATVTVEADGTASVEITYE